MGIYVGNKRYAPYIGDKRRRYMGGRSSLPYDAEIDYLQSTGTAYIDTGITPTLSYSVEMEFYLVSPLSSESASATMFGTLNGWNKNTFMVACTPSIYRIYNCWGNKNTSYTDQSYVTGIVDNWHTLVFRDKKILIDDTQIGNAVASPSGNPVGSIHLFCAKNYADNTLYGIGSTKRIRRYKIYDADFQLVLNLKSVRVGTTGYMYDKVSKQLFGNAGTDDFVLGPDKSTLPYDAEVEWIQSTGNEYIDTGFKPSTDIRLTVDGSFVTASGNNHIFGCMNTVGTITRFHIGINASQFQGGIGTKYGRIGRISSDTNRHIFHISGIASQAYVDDDYYTGDGTYPNLNIFLFARNTNGSAANQHPFIMYSAYVYEYSTQEKLADYIPVRKNGVGYLYDRISGQLFGAPTGAFTLGPDKT